MSDAGSDRESRKGPKIWPHEPLHRLVTPVTKRNTIGNENVLTISAKEGLIRQEEYFNRVVASGDLAPYTLLERGDFAYNKSYSIGYPVGVIRRLDRFDSGVVSPLYVCFRARSGAIEPDYLNHYLTSGMADDQIASVAKEGARNHGLLNVGKKDFYAIRVPVPPVERQRRIVAIIDTFDDAIRTAEQLVAKKEELHTALLRALFDGRTQTTSVADVVDPNRPVTYGIVQPGPRQPEGIGVPLVRGQDYDNGYVTMKELYRVRQDIDASYTRSRLRGGDLLISIVGARVGTVGHVPESLNGANITQTTARVAIASPNRPKYFFHQFISPAFQSEVRRYTKGSAQPGLNLSDVERMAVCIPPVEEQERAVALLDTSVAAIGAEQASLRKLRTVRHGLVTDLLSERVKTAVL